MMGILNAIESELSDVAQPIEDAASPIVKPAIGGLADLGRAAGSALVGSNAGAPPPKYSVDPNTGQMTSAPGTHSYGNLFRNMLAGALSGLASSHPGQSGAQALGQGYAAAQVQEQHQQELARQQAEQQFGNDLAATKAQDYNKYLNAMRLHLQASTLQQQQQTKLEAQQGREAAQRSLDLMRKNRLAMGDIHLEDINGPDDLQALLQKHPNLAHEYASGQVDFDYDAANGRYEVYQVSGDLRGAIQKPIRIVTGFGQDGKPITRTYAAGSISRAQAATLQAQSNQLTQQYVTQQERSHEANARIAAANAEAASANARGREADARTAALNSPDAKIDLQTERYTNAIAKLLPIAYGKDLATGQYTTLLTSPTARRAQAQIQALQDRLDRLTGVPAQQPTPQNPAAQQKMVRVKLANGLTGSMPIADAQRMSAAGQLTILGANAPAEPPPKPASLIGQIISPSSPTAAY